MKKLIAGAVLIAALVFAPASGAVIKGSVPLTFSRYQATFLSPLDGQGSPSAPVYNTTGCAWNDQDKIVNRGAGSVTGAVENTICMVADFDDSGRGNYPKNVLLWVAGPETLQVWITNDVGDSWTATSAAYGSQRLWELCISDPVADAANVDGDNPLTFWPEIPNTNGGRGKIVNYTLHIRSTKNTARKVEAYFEVAQSGNAAPGRTLDAPCPANDGV